MFDPSAKELHDGQCRHKLHLFHKYHMLHCCYMPNAAQSGVPGAPSFWAFWSTFPDVLFRGLNFSIGSKSLSWLDWEYLTVLQGSLVHLLSFPAWLSLTFRSISNFAAFEDMARRSLRTWSQIPCRNSGLRWRATTWHYVPNSKWQYHAKSIMYLCDM